MLMKPLLTTFHLSVNLIFLPVSSVVDPDPELVGQVGIGSGKIISDTVLEPDPRLNMTNLT